MKKKDNIIELLKNVQNRVDSYVYNPTPENIKIFTDGLKLGYFICEEKLNSNHFIDHWIEIVEKRGWDVNLVGFNQQMKDKGMTDDEIIYELITIEIETWKSL